MIVVDASVVVQALSDDTEPGDQARQRLGGEPLAAPHLLDIEVLAALRGLHRAGRINASRAQTAVSDLRDLPVVRSPHPALLHRIWELRDNVTVYDAAYVALAEALGVILLTRDARLAGATGLRCTVELLR